MAVLEEVSTITAKGQTTVPKAVRQVLGIDYGGRVAFRVEKNHVTLHAVEEAHEDPALGSFLEFLAKDIGQRPQAIKPLSREFAARMARLTKSKKIDLDAEIDGAVDL